MSQDVEMIEIRLLQLPVPLWAKSKELTDELLREFALSAAQGDDGEHHLPNRLIALRTALSATYSGATTAQEERMFAAAAAGEESIDELRYELPVAVGSAAKTLGDMLDEADEYCREGQHLLTLAAPEDVVRFRRWYLSEFARQAAGAAPTAWPDYDGSWL